jgi:hypothetical protein
VGIPPAAGDDFPDALPAGQRPRTVQIVLDQQPDNQYAALPFTRLLKNKHRGLSQGRSPAMRDNRRRSHATWRDRGLQRALVPSKPWRSRKNAGSGCEAPFINSLSHENRHCKAPDAMRINFDRQKEV